jgi:hypothetical protein
MKTTGEQNHTKERKSQMGKNWCFTWNNYSADWKEKLALLETDYLVCQEELGDTTGTPHLQGFVRFKSNKRFNAVTKLMPGMHIEQAKCSMEKCIAYCTKEKTRYGEQYEIGTRTTQGTGNKIRWEEAYKAAQEGRIEDIPAELKFRFYKTIKAIIHDHQKIPDTLETANHLWIYGETGTGKTHAVRTQCTDLYLKPLNKWWDGYQNQSQVHIDEIAPEHTPYFAANLKIWVDKFAFPAECKGYSITIRPKKIIITSNYTIDEMGFNEKDLPAIKRRFKEIKKTREQDIII